MSNTDIEEDKKKLQPWAPPKLKLITGGIDGTDAEDKDWLWKLDVGTPFLSKPTHSQHHTILHQWVVSYKYEGNGRRAVRLVDLENPANKLFVDSRDFSMHNRHFITLEWPENE